MATAIEEPPKSMALGLGTVGGAPADADSPAKPADTPSTAFNPQALPEPPDTPHPSRTPAPEDAKHVPPMPSDFPAEPVATKPEPDKGPPADFPATPVEAQKPDQAKPGPPADFPAEPAKVEQPPTAMPSGTGAAAPQGSPAVPPVPPTPMPSGTGMLSPQGSPLPDDPQEQLAALVERGFTSGQAQALIAGEIPKSLSGKTPVVPTLKPSPQATPPIDNLGTLGDEPLIKEIQNQPAPKSTTTTAPDAPAPVLNPQGKPASRDDLSDSDKALYDSGVEKAKAGQMPTDAEQHALYNGNFDASKLPPIELPPQTVTAQPPAKSKLPTPIDTLKADNRGHVDPVQLYSYLLNKFANSDLVKNHYIPPDGKRWGIKTGSAAEWAAFGLAVAKQESDLDTKSYNGADPGGSAGLFQFGPHQAPFAQGDQFNPQESADAFVRSVEHYVGNKGNVANMGATFGSIRRPNEAGQYISGAQKVAAGGDGKDLVSSGGGYHGTGGGSGSGSKEEVTLVPMAGSAAHSPEPPRAQTPESIGGGGGGGGGYSSAAPDSSGGGGGSLNFFGGGKSGQAAADESAPSAPPRYRPQQMSVQDITPDQSPLVTALMNRGFSQQQALNYAQSSANVAPGKGVPAINVQGPAPAAPGLPPPSGATLSLAQAKPKAPIQIAPIKPGKSFVLGKGTPPAAPGKPTKAPPQLPAPAQPQQAPRVDPSVVLGLMKRGFSREQAMAVASKATVSKGIGETASFRPPAAAPPPAKPQPQAPAQAPPPRIREASEPTAFTGRPPGSTHGDPNPKGLADAIAGLKPTAAAKAHAAVLSDDDPRVRKQADGYVKGEHFVEGDPFHEQLLSGLPYGKQGHQRGLLAQAETAIADKSPMHISYISAPKEAAKFPTRETRTTQYDEHSPEARLMGTTEGQLVGHSFIPLAAGVKLSTKAGEPHQSYLQGISTNVMANNFQHVNDKLAAMGRKSPYKEMGAKFQNDLEGYYSNLLAGHTATGRGYVAGTEHHPMEPDREHVPYKLSRKEADFIGTVINNTAAFAKHDDAKAIRELARVNGSLITEKGETNRMRHDIEEHEPGWRERVLEPTIRSFKTGLIHEIHPSEEHMPMEIRPGKHYQSLTKSIARTSERGRPDIAIAAGLHHNFEDNRKINEIERDFSDHKIEESMARTRLKALGEDPDEYRFVGGSGGLITPYEEDPEALTPEEHDTMKNNLRQAWVGGKMNVEDYRKKAAEVPLPQKPSKNPRFGQSATRADPQPTPKPVTTTAEPVEAPEAPPVPKPIAPKPPKPPKPKAPPKPEPEDIEAPEMPEAPPPAPAPKPEIVPDEPTEAPATPPAPDEPLPPVKKPKAAPEAPLEALKATALEKPSWKTANEKTRQAYLKQRVAHDMERQYKGADAHQLEVDRNEEDNSIKYDPAGNPIYKKVDYDLANSPLLKKKGLNQLKGADEHPDTLGNLIGPDGKEVIDPDTGKPVLKHTHLNQVERSRLSAMHTASAVHTMGNKIVDEFMKIKDQPEIMAGEGWYSRMRKKLADALGEHHELFAQLLGATSAKTPVRNNFIQSLDALEQFKQGKFDNHIKKYQEAFGKMQEGKGALVQHMKNQGIPLYDKDGNTVDTHDTDAAAMANWIHHHGILPRQQIQEGQEEGSKYNANSVAVLRALAGTWLKEIGAPKTPNFAGNLTGRTLEATIDVWAARFLKRLGYEGQAKGPWRSQGKSEPGVNSLDFAFSQDAMRHAADEITKRTGKKMNPDDLQAIAWFAEKHHWEKRGWTRGAGAEKSSFDDVADLAFPKTGEPMTSADLRKHYGALQEEAKRVKARVKTAKNYVGHADPKMRAKLEPYMEKHGLTHEQVHGPEVEEEDEDAA